MANSQENATEYEEEPYTIIDSCNVVSHDPSSVTSLSYAHHQRRQSFIESSFRTTCTSLKWVFSGVLDGIKTHPQGTKMFKHKNISTFPEDLEIVDFPTLCKSVHHRIEMFSDDLKPEGASTQLHLEAAAIQLEEKKIMINFLAECNTGKSTMLNALLGDSFLPTSQSAETGLKVVIMHDSKVHDGVCLSNCPYFQQHKNCPRLEIKGYENVEETFGVKNIRDKIKELNRAQRENKLTSVPELCLKVNIPLLAERIPEGWTVNLVDNPGFGEYVKSIAQAASQSLETSSVYVILSSPETSGTKMEVDTFQFLHTKRDVFKQHNADRLIVALTKCDTFHQVRTYIDDSETELSLVEVQARVCQSVQEATNEKCLSESDILPVSGQWGVASSKLRNCLITSGTPVAGTEQFKEEYKRRLQRGQYLVGSTPKFTCGQGCMEIELQHMKAEEVIEKLEDASGLHLLNDRIAEMLKTSSRKLWATNLCDIYSLLLRQLEQLCFGIRVRRLKVEIEGQMKKYDSQSKDLYKVLETKKKLKATLKQKKKTDVWKRMSEACEADIKETDLIRHAESFCIEEVANFSAKCKKSLEDHSNQFTPKDFESNISAFLEGVEKHLQQIFNLQCSFKHLNEVMFNSILLKTVEITKLYGQAEYLCSINPVSAVTVYAIKSGDATFIDFKDVAQDAPSLGDIIERLNIPHVQLSIFQKFFLFIKNLFTSGESREGTVDTTSDVNYRKWDETLEGVMSYMLQSMNKECEKYVEDIHQKATEYFYKQYVTIVGERLGTFRNTFRTPLQSIEKELIKLEKYIEDLAVDLHYCSQVEEHLNKLGKNLHKACDQFVAQLDA